jgi:hypothetical protein
MEESMRKVFRMVAAAGAIAAAAASAGAQPALRADGASAGQAAAGPGLRGRGPGRGVEGGVPGGVVGGIGDYVAGEIPLGPIVKGAPFCADGVTSSSQTLGDGTKLSRTVNARICRDGEGRVRREQTILGLGALASSNEPLTIVTIVDPVAGVRYVLVPTKKEASRSPMPGGRGGARGRSNQSVDIGGVPPPPPPPPPPPDGEVHARSGGPGRGSPQSGLPNAPEALGTKQIEGVNATGTRRTETIPTGTIGNDRPITITDERWESTDLKVLVSSDHHDPRTGDVKYRLTNINRSEPDGVLFTVPSDYTLREMPPPPPPAPGARGRG